MPELLGLDGGDGAVVNSLLDSVLGVGGNLVDGDLGNAVVVAGQVPSHIPQPMQSSLTVAFMVKSSLFYGPLTRLTMFLPFYRRRGN